MAGLAEILGADRLSEEHDTPVVTPRDQAEVAELLAAATRDGLALTIRGGGTKRNCSPTSCFWCAIARLANFHSVNSPRKTRLQSLSGVSPYDRSTRICRALEIAARTHRRPAPTDPVTCRYLCHERLFQYRLQ